MRLDARGGAAAGDPSNNPATGTYASIPPSSTYKGPTVAGTYGGFVGVFVASLLVGLALVVVLVVLRLRTLRRRALREEAIYREARGGGGGRRGGRGFGGGGDEEDDPEDLDDEWTVADDAFEMPVATTGRSYDDRTHVQGSALHLVDDPDSAVLYRGSSPPPLRLYAAPTDADAVEDTAQRYRDPYAPPADGFRTTTS